MQKATIKVAETPKPESAPVAASPASPLPPDDDSNNDDNTNYKEYSAKEIERRYNLEKNQFHREIKPQIEADLKNPSIGIS